MANILYRGSTPSAANASTGGVSRPLTNDEIDKNFYALNSLKIETESDTLATVTGRGSSTNTNLSILGTTNYIKNLTGYDFTHLTINGAPNTSGSGYDIRLTAGSVVSGTGLGGSINLNGGNASGSAAGGFVNFYGGTGGTDREGGQVNIRGGQYGPSSGAAASAGRGGDVTIQGGYGGQGGNATGGARGGHVYIKPGVGGVATPASTYIYAPTSGTANVNSGSGSESIVAEFNSSIIKLSIGEIQLGSQFAAPTIKTMNQTSVQPGYDGTTQAITIKTGDSFYTAGYIFVTPGLTSRSTGTGDRKGGNLYLIGGGAEGPSNYNRIGGDVYLEAGGGQRWSGASGDQGGAIYIGTVPNRTSGSTGLSQAGTNYIMIGHNGYNILGGMGDSVGPSSTTIKGSVSFDSLGIMSAFGQVYFGSNVPFYIGGQNGSAGSVWYDAWDEVSFGYGVKVSTADVNHTVGAADAYATRIVSGLNTGYSQGCTFKFQRASSKTFNSVISWVDDLSITNTGDIRVRANIYAGGDIYAFSTSDQTLKTNIVRIDSALAKVNSLDGITFNWNEVAEEKLQKDVNVRETGVIAQQVQAVLPEVIQTREDGTLAVDYSKMVPLLIEAIKELTSKVEDLQNQLMNK